MKIFLLILNIVFLYTNILASFEFKCNNELLLQKKRKQTWHQVIEIKFHQRPQNLPLNWGNQQMRKDHLPW